MNSFSSTKLHSKDSHDIVVNKHNVTALFLQCLYFSTVFVVTGSRTASVQFYIINWLCYKITFLSQATRYALSFQDGSPIAITLKTCRPCSCTLSEQNDTKKGPINCLRSCFSSVTVPPSKSDHCIAPMPNSIFHQPSGFSTFKVILNFLIYYKHDMMEDQTKYVTNEWKSG